MRTRGIAAIALTLPLLGALGGVPAAAAPLGEAPTAPSGPLRLGGLLEAGTVWSRYKERFLSPDGRIVDTGNDGISHSEGQGYGLLLAVAAADRAAFDRILSWTNRNLFIREDHLAAWRWSAGRGMSRFENNATDGDILIAWALAEAADFWRDPVYLARAQRIAADIAATLLRVQKPFGPVLSPGVRGFSASDRPDGPVVNLSYWVFPAFPRLERLAPGADWRGLEATGLSLIETPQADGYEPTGDWSALGDGSVRPAQGFPSGFGYDAIRIPLYAFWSGAAAPRLMRALSGATEQRSERRPGSSAGSIPSFTEPGYQNVWSLARCASSGRAYPPEFYTFTAEQNYYPATLGALSLLAAAYRGGPCLDRRAMARVLCGREPTAASDLSQIDTSAVVLPTSADSAPTDTRSDAIEPSLRGPLVSPVPLPAQLAPTSASGAVAEFVEGLLGLGLPAGALALYWRRRRSRRKRLETLIAPEANAPSGPFRSVPRNLPANPYYSTNSLDVLGGQIENAATVSVEFGRTLGIIYFQLGGPESQKTEAEGNLQDGDLGELMNQFRGVLRTTDRVVVIDGAEIIACISLLPGSSELASIAERLRIIGRRSAKYGSTFEAPAGLSIYPMCGYRAAELIDHARRDYHGRKRTNQLQPNAQTVEVGPVG